MKINYRRADGLKRAIALFMSLVMILGLFPAAAWAAPTGSEDGLFTSVGMASYGTTYYVDAENGNDQNSGRSHTSPWKTLDKVTDTTFLPGDHILLRTGSIWNGQMLYPKGNGNALYPIVIDFYDLDQEGQPVFTSDTRPIINGNGTEGIGSKKTIISGTVMLYNQEYWEIRNLEVTNSEDLNDPEAYKKDGTTQRAGILAYSDNQHKIYEHIVIKDCYIHDIQSEYYQKPKDISVGGLKAVGGIIILGHHLDPDGELVAESRGKSTAGYHDVLIEGNVLKRVGLEGIRTKCNSNTTMSGNTFNKTFSDIIIRNNYLEDIAGDGIVLTEVFEGGLVESNIAKQPNNADYGTHNYAGIWSMYADKALFQYNEVYGIVYGYNDGEAYDIDMACYDNTYQYNYSHHNGGGFMLFMGNQYDSVVRYNISANDGGGSRGVGADGGANNSYTYKEQSIFHYWNKADNNTMPTIYNNTIYVGDGISTSLYGEGNSSDNSGVRARFYNNILLKEGSGSLKFLANYPANGSNAVERKLGAEPEKYMRNNLIWPESIATEKSGATPEILAEGGNLFMDPLLVIQEDAENLDRLAEQNQTQFDVTTDDIYEYTSKDALRGRASLFMLQDSSPALGKGMPIETDLEEDFFGNPIQDVVPDIGAHQLSAISFRTELTEIEPVEVTTLAGIYPALPQTVAVELTDIMGDEQTTRNETLPVIWDMIDLESYTQDGEFIVEGSIKGFTEKAEATVTVIGSISEDPYVWDNSCSQDAYIQRSDGNLAYGDEAGSISYSLSSSEAIKHPFKAGFSNNYVLKVKNAASAGYNRRFLISFDLEDFEEALDTVKHASIRLHIARYDSWNGAGSTVDEQLKNTSRILDVYAVEEDWDETILTWNNAPDINDEVTVNNHNGGGSSDNQVPTYEDTVPVAHKEYSNRDIIANNHTIDIDVTDYILQLEDGTGTVSFLVDIPYDPSYNKDNSGFDAFSKEGALAAFEAYEDGKFAAGVEVESETSLAPQIVLSNLYETGIEEIVVETKAGKAPVLPEEAELIYSDGTTKMVGVRWNTIPTEDYQEEGSFYVYGTSTVTNLPIKARVDVTADYIESVGEFETIHTAAGKAMNALGLPNQCLAQLSSGETKVIMIDSWNDSFPPYSSNRPADEYDFTGVLNLPTGITNPYEIDVSQKVITHPNPTDITFTQAPSELKAGSQASYQVSVILDEEKEDEWSQEILWEVTTGTGELATGVSIDQNGLLSTTLDAAVGDYTITVKSAVNPAIQEQTTVTVKAPDLSDLIIQSAEQPAPIYVVPGTEEEDISFPAQVTVILSGNRSLQRGITEWSCTTEYNPTLEGEYVFSGTIQLDGGLVLQNPDNVKAMVTVVVGLQASENDKLLLELAIEEAQAAIDDGTAEKLIPSVKEAFLEAYEAAKAVYTNADATKKQVEQAKTDLIEMIWMLDYIQADKQALNEQITEAEKIMDLSIYTDASAETFKQALIKAKELQSDLELTTADQQIVDQAASALKTAREGLIRKAPDRAQLSTLLTQAQALIDNGTVERLIPSVKAEFERVYAQARSIYENVGAAENEITDACEALIQLLAKADHIKADKTALAAIIAKAETYNLSNYTTLTATAVRLALKHAEELNADPELWTADQERIDEACQTLQKAIDNLRSSEQSSGGSSAVIVKDKNRPQSAGSGWQLKNGSWFYQNAEGKQLVSEWLKYQDRWYYLDETGAMASGWKQIAEIWYWFDPGNGKMVENDWVLNGALWYYLGVDGVMQTGWLSYKSEWYYLSPVSDGFRGHMVKNTNTPDGYFVNENGIWVK